MFQKFIKSLIVSTIIICIVIVIVLSWYSIMHPSIKTVSIITIKMLLGIVIFLLCALRGLDMYMNIQSTDKHLLQQLQSIDETASLHYHTNNSGYTLRYAELGDKNKPTLMFVHGTPGSLSDAFPLLQKTDILTQYHIIIPDRPGFGGSMNGKAMPNIQEQATLLSELLFLPDNSSKVTLVGWSYAGALLPYMAARYGENMASMIVVAGTMGPDDQTIWKISYPLHYTWLRYIIPPMLRVTNSEKLKSIEQLTAHTGIRSDITVPVGLLHGKKDWIVKIENTYFARDQLINSPKVITKIIDDSGHEIPITRPQLIIDMLQELSE